MDTRRDAGEFYPGGKVISTRPVATGGDVKHSDFADLDVKTNTLPDLRAAVKGLAARLGATVVTALAACVATAATVQTVPVNDLDFDANPSVVTNVVFDAPPDFSTNNTELVETIEAKAPIPTWDTLSGKPTFALVATSGAYSDLSGKPTIPTTAADVGAWPAVEGSEWGMGSAGLTLYLRSDYLSGSYCFGIDSEWHVMRRQDVEAATNATLAAAMTYTDNHTPDIGSAISNAVPAWARAASKPTYTAAEVGAYPTNETMYVDYIGDVGCIYGDYMPSGVWDFGDGCIRLASWYQFNLHMPDGRQADGIEIFDTADPTIKTVIPINGSDVATIADIPDVPASVSNTVTTAYVHEKLGAWMEYDEATGLYYYCHEEE